MTTLTGPPNTRSSHSSLQSGATMNLAKTLQVQDQIIEQLRSDQVALREALDSERASLRDCRLTSDRELKALQREKLQVEKLARQLEVKVEDLEKELAFTKDALILEQKNLKDLEKEHMNNVREFKLKIPKDMEKMNKQEAQIDHLKSEVEELKEALQSERNATNLLIREHNAEVKMLRQEVKTKSTEAYRELKERATREREEYREIQEEAEKTYKVLEKDFRDALATKDEELRKVKMEAKVIQKELEDQLRASLKEPVPFQTPVPAVNSEYIEGAKFRRLKNEMSVLREQNRKLLNEIQALTEDNRVDELGVCGSYVIPYSVPPRNFDTSKNIKPGDKAKKSLSSVPDKNLEPEVTRMASEFSVNSKNFSKRQSKSSLSMRRDEGFKPYPRSKTEERYEELKRTMQILRKALQ